VADPWEQVFVDAANLADAGDRQGAVDLLLPVLDREDVPPFGRSLAATNIGTMNARSERVDEAMAWYERAVTLDPDGEGAGVALGEKAMLLHSLERHHEAVATFERMLALPHLREDSRAAVEYNLRLMRGD